jgi:hypothetical protein
LAYRDGPPGAGFAAKHHSFETYQDLEMMVQQHQAELGVMAANCISSLGSELPTF